MDKVIPGFFWMALFLAVIIVPTALMLVPSVPAGRPFWLETSIALGFFGLVQIALQFMLIARFKSVTGPYGIDAVLQLHRHLALIAIAIILAHPLIIMIDNPSRMKLLNPLAGNWASRFALLSVLALLTTAITSLYREQLKLKYEVWRLCHIVCGVLAIVFAQAHVSLAGLYTNTYWKHGIWIILALLTAGLVLYLRLAKPAWQHNNRWRIVEVRPERGNTWTLALEADQHAGIFFLAGQFAWIKLGDSFFTLREHPFSFSSSARNQTRVEFSIKELGDFTSTIKDVQIGTSASLDGPHGAFCIDRYPAVGYVFIAGGIGITPMMSFLRSMSDRRDPRPVLLFYAEQEWESVAFREELERLEGQLDLRLIYVLENPPDGWQGEKGMITQQVLDKHLPRELIHRNFFICGPQPMMTAVHAALMKQDIRKDCVHMERFNLA